ncbi:MAG: HNH endonuclease [Anaerolineaceae bacterium]|nr:HNH endonuclease [Anaerolineaceae bacterium]
MAKKTLLERLNEKLKLNEETGCLEWHGAKDKRGTGITKIGRAEKQVHRLIWENSNGYIPEGAYIKRKCENQVCCNTKHMYLYDTKRGLYERWKERVAPAEDHPDGCMIWQGGSDKDGYGIFTYEGKTYRAHRVAYELFNGELGNGMFACHTCDTPSCANPEHIFEGTSDDNKKDCVSKNRHSHEESHGRSKLTSAQIHDIRDAYELGINIVAIAKVYGISHTMVSNIGRGKFWTRSGGTISEARSVRIKWNEQCLIVIKYAKDVLGYSYERIAKAYNVESHQIGRAYVAAGGKINSPKKWNEECVKVIRYYKDTLKFSFGRIAKAYGCSDETIRRLYHDGIIYGLNDPR